jgi:hypothetical protein
MSKGRWAFRPKDIARAIKGADSAGPRAEIDPATGKIVLIFGKSVVSAGMMLSAEGRRYFHSLVAP